MIRAILVMGVLLQLTAGYAATAPQSKAASGPADELRVLPAQGKVGPLAAYLKNRAKAALDRREAAFNKIETPDQIAAWQRQRRVDFLAALGDFPERTPLKAQVVGRMEFADYRIEKIIFESQPGFFVTGTLYLPLTPGPHPAVVHPTGHSEAAKARDLYQRASIVLAKNGIACLCYDPIGQGERRQLLDENGKARFATTREHQILGIGCTLLGSSLARTMIWDGMRAIDFLQSRPEIDPKRIGCVGISGGGTMTSYLGALDERVAVSAPGCYLTGFDRLLETIGPQDIEQNLYNQIEAGLEQVDYVVMRAPRPTLIMAATRDFFDIGGARNILRQSRGMYGRLGAAEKVNILEAETEHGYPIEHREGGAQWFRRWFLGSDRPVKEDNFAVLPESEVNSTPTGQVLRLPGARSHFDLNRDIEAKLAKTRAELWRDRNAALKEVRRVSKIRPLAALPEVKADTVETLSRKGYSIRKLVLNVEPAFKVPALWFEPASVDRKHAPVLYVHGNGKHVDAKSDGRIEKLVAAGRRVLAIDPRGVPEGGWPQSTDSAVTDIVGQDSKDWTLAYLLGTSLVALRAEDILACARYLAVQSGTDVRPELVAVGLAVAPSLHAAALEPKTFSALQIDSTPSWQQFLRDPLSPGQQTTAIFGALKVYDLPDLATAAKASGLKVVSSAR